VKINRWKTEKLFNKLEKPFVFLFFLPNFKNQTLHWFLSHFYRYWWFLLNRFLTSVQFFNPSDVMDWDPCNDRLRRHGWMGCCSRSTLARLSAPALVLDFRDPGHSRFLEGPLKDLVVCRRNCAECVLGLCFSPRNFLLQQNFVLLSSVLFYMFT
jgi:hypothetical protein